MKHRKRRLELVTEEFVGRPLTAEEQRFNTLLVGLMNYEEVTA
jgi:hypothetical protein